MSVPEPRAALDTGDRPALTATTLCEAFQATASEHSDRVALRTRADAARLTWGEYGERVRSVAAGLAGLGVKRGDSVGLMLDNRPEFQVVDSAAMHLGATCFSVYTTAAPEQIDYVLTNAANRVIIVEARYLDLILASRERVPTLEHVVVIDGQSERAMTLEELEATADSAFDFDATWRSVQPDDVLCLIYTSGTTGPPKGVELTHANVMSMLRALHQVLPLRVGTRAVSFLPHAHIADRSVFHYAAMVHAYTVTTCPRPAELFDHAVDAQPTLFGAVPRVWEKFKASLEASFAAEADPRMRATIDRARQVGLLKVRCEQRGETPPAALLAEHETSEELVLAPLRRRHGLGEVQFFIAGAAAMPLDVLEFFHALGIPILELWGMSETTAIATINPPHAPRLGTVGVPLPGVELKVADDGEVLVRGEIVMSGYRSLPDETAAAFADGGWLRTGDVGEIDEAGYLRIVDRKKELIVNAAGLNMSPTNIEARIKAGSALIGQVVAIGDGRPYNVALITLEPEATATFARARRIDTTSVERLATHPDAIAEVKRGVEAGNEKLSRVEQVKRFAVLPISWVPGSDELTPTMKLKRKTISQKYATEIEALYSP